jgi:hypothetical protein
MERRARLRAVLSVVVLAVAVVACKPPPPPPPVVSVGDPIFGPNPAIEGTAGARETKVSYGPWTVPAATGTGHDQMGMIDDIKFAIPRPCTDCWITAAIPQLKNADGTVANTDTGAWLHHFAFFNNGALDATCGATAIQLLGERFFVGANERTPGRFPANVGYRTRPLDSWSLLVDLMNTTTTAQQVSFELTWKWVPAATPNMRNGKPVWIDVNADCAQSPFPQQQGQYSKKRTWPVAVPGRVMGLAGHVHDGATRIILRNVTTGEVLCDAKAYYGGPGFEGPEGGGGHEHGGASHPEMHVSAVDQCVSRSIDRPLAIVEKGQQVEVEAFYDSDLHAQMPGEDIMGVYIMYVLQ